jgi:hypothetical protein
MKVILKRMVPWMLGYVVIAGYVVMGVFVGIGEYRHQAARFDPGFDPLVAGVLAGFFWPLELASRLLR